MANAWTQVNQVAHQAIVAVLSGRGGRNSGLGVSNRQVTLDITPLEAVAKQDLVARGLTIAGKIPIAHATFALFPSKNLAKAQKAYRLINDLKIVLPIVTLNAARRRCVGRPGPPAGADRRRARVRRVHAGPRRRPVDRPGHLPEQRARQHVRGRGRPPPSASWSGSSRPRSAPCWSWAWSWPWARCSPGRRAAAVRTRSAISSGIGRLRRAENPPACPPARSAPTAAHEPGRVCRVIRFGGWQIIGDGLR